MLAKTPKATFFIFFWFTSSLAAGVGQKLKDQIRHEMMEVEVGPWYLPLLFLTKGEEKKT